jgi:PAS domain S-box-containing protein
MAPRKKAGGPSGEETQKAFPTDAESATLRRFIENSPFSVGVLDGRGNCLFVNQAFRELFSVPEDFSFSGMNAVEDPANIAAGVDLYLRRAMAGEAVEYEDVEFCSPISERRIVTSGKVFPVYDDRGEITYVVVVHEDITERKLAEEELEEYRGRLEEMVRERTERLARLNDKLRKEIETRTRAEKELLRIKKLDSLGVMAGGIAHDFNNLLAEIIGGVSLAKWQMGSKSVGYETLCGVERACAHARELTQRLLTFSRGGAPVRDKARIDRLCEEAVRSAEEEPHTRIDCFIDDDLWPCWCDLSQLRQVVINLLANAKQALEGAGVITLRAENTELCSEPSFPLPAGRYVKLSVADTGRGIDGEDLERIFDPFFTTKKDGHGLGLATSDSIVRNHGGHIHAESAPDQGSVFTVLLPAAVEQSDDGPPPSRLRPAKGRVLLMDDEPGVRQVVSGMIRYLGYEVEAVEEGEKAVEAYREALESGHRFDLVILDVTVPDGMGGKETIGELLEIDPEVISIVSSGYSNDRILANYKDHGFRAMIAKPYRIEDLGELLRRLGC